MNKMAPKVQQVYDKLGKFKPEPSKLPNAKSPELGVYEYLEDGSTYIGQYLNGKRHGYGTLVKNIVSPYLTLIDLKRWRDIRRLLGK
jgi:hypothetical protein